MSQNVVDYSGNPTGPQLMDNYLAKDQENRLTTNSGIQRPSYAVAGTPWINTSTTPWTLYVYDGTSDVAIGTINATTHEFISSNFANVVNLTTAQSVAGVKTFTDKPLVPTPTSTDNVATVVNKQYVGTVETNLNTAIGTKAGLSSNNAFTGSNSFTNSPTVPTPAVSSNTTVPATTAYVNNKFQKVNSLPQNPDEDIWYAIPEE